VVLLIEQWVKVKRLLPFVIAFIASAIALLFFIKHMLLVAIILSIASIVLLRLIKIQSNE
jgi:predicted branched-subunit amino acid permease